MVKVARAKWLPILLSVLALVGAALACGPGPTETEEPAGGPDVTGATKEPVKPPASGAVSTLEGVKSATIQIEAQGTFVDPGVGLVVNAAGRGSGFIIDPSGIAVTNNHVVTGAALLKVWIGGEDEVYNAQVLGVSECSDLAVIDIEGEGFPYLEWYDGDISTGLEIYVAGYPLGDPEYTLLQGIVSKEKAGGETTWASVDYVIEHTALTNPGNSGGPVVTADGQIVGIHYAGVSETEQHYAISRNEAQPIVETMAGGKDVDTIGVNGTAVMSEDGSISGIWVASVASGSPADKAGIKGGDIISSLEGLVLSTDGTMADYCDVLRSHQPDDTLSLGVLRYATGEYLEGQLNGRALESSYSFGTELQAGGEEGATAGDTGAYSEYVSVTDDYGAIQMSIPAEWGEVDGSSWTGDSGADFASIWAAPILEDFNTTWGTPGVKFNVTEDVAKLGGYIQMLDAIRQSAFLDDCELDGRYDYQDQLYRGKYDYFVKCGSSRANYLILSAVPIDNPSDYLLFVEIQIVEDRDLDAADAILNSFQVVGSLP